MEVVSPALPRQQRLNLRLIPAGISLAYSLALTILLFLRMAHINLPIALTVLISLTVFCFIPLPISLALAILSRSRTAIVAALVLSGFAIVWLGTIFIPHTTAHADGQVITITTFNTGGRNQLVDEFQTWLNENPVDLALLQETFIIRLNPGIEGVRRTYPHQAIQTTELGYRGNSTLSAYSINEDGREGFTSDSVFTRVVIDFNGTQIAVYNVSLAAPFDFGGGTTLPGLLLNYDTQERDEQVGALIDRLSREELPAIVSGDFNLTEFEPAYSRLAEVLNDSFRVAGSGLGFTFPSGGTYSFSGALQPVLRIDYVWYSDEFRALSAEVGEPLGSDHLPLTVQLDFIGS